MTVRVKALIRGAAALKQKPHRVLPMLLLLAFSLANGALALLLSADALGSAAARDAMLAARSASRSSTTTRSSSAATPSSPPTCGSPARRAAS